jgi:hypothetical protein
MEIQLIIRPMEENKSTDPGIWLPLIDYALRNKVSLSTLRRQIKANKIPHKLENGKYLIWDPNKKQNSENFPLSAEALKLELLKAREEIAELKTLIAFYEENNPQKLDC